MTTMPPVAIIAATAPLTAVVAATTLPRRHSRSLLSGNPHLRKQVMQGEALLAFDANAKAHIRTLLLLFRCGKATFRFSLISISRLLQMVSANIEVIHEVSLNPLPSGYRLCFHWGKYAYDNGTEEHGYRFMWRDPDNHLQTHLGQARIPTAAEMLELIHKATKAGWFVKCES